MTGQKLSDNRLLPNHTLRSLITANPVLRAYIEEQQSQGVGAGGGAGAVNEQARAQALFGIRNGGLYLFSASKGSDRVLKELGDRAPAADRLA